MARRSTRIRDGMTLTGQVPPLPGVHDGLKFEYRPAVSLRVIEYLQAPKASARKSQDEIVKLLAEHVLTWEEDGPVTEQALRETYHSVLLQMVDFVTGYSGSLQEDSLKNCVAAPLSA